MTSLLAVLCLNAATVGNTVDLKLSGDAQLRAGYTHTPFVAGPDGTPLLNAPTSAEGSAESDLILSPGLEFDLTVRRFKLALGYKPRVFLDVLNLATVPTVFHKMNLGMTLGRPNDWLLAAGADVSVGGLDYGQAGQIAQEFSGALRPGTSASALGFFNLSAYVKGETAIGRAWKFSTVEVAKKMDTPPVSASNFVSSNDPNAINLGAGSIITLQSQQQAESQNELSYKLNEQHHLLFDLTLNVTSFPGTVTYLSMIPQVGWTAELSKLTRFRLKLGVMRYWTNPYAGRFDKVQNQAVGEVGIEHKFADFGLPRLTCRASFTEGPYYDIIYGLLEPRATLALEAAYDFDRQWQGALQFRDYTEAYWDGKWRTIPKGHNKNVSIVSLQLKYKYSRWVSYQAGVYGLNRSLVPSATSTSTQLQDVYVSVGVTGNYDVVE